MQYCIDSGNTDKFEEWMGRRASGTTCAPVSVIVQQPDE
ncbi:hypothetical protein D088_850028 [Salmonella enterica subsp. houtenae serovar 16:z4,z32:-- str. RKS3027]|nr:hypothetical protein D088_850028 [Salmonella enterica subsp. houtenae serovar 16:z4,z32:-- str. RKS3027]